MTERIGPKVLRRFREGDPSAVRELYGAFAGPVFALAVRSLGDRGLAEEVVQQTFLQAWRAAGSFDPERDPAPWLYAIARRVSVDLYRRERRHHSTVDEPEIAVLPPSFELAWETWQVRLAVDRLTEEERSVVRATHYEGMTHEDAAEELGVPVGTVKSRSHRAHRKLAGMLRHLHEESA